MSSKKLLQEEFYQILSRMHLRINGHRSDAKKNDKLSVDTHFLQPGLNFERDAKFTIIEKIKRTDLSGTHLTNLLLRREDFWMTKLGTIESERFNTGLNFPINMPNDCLFVHSLLLDSYSRL